MKKIMKPMLLALILMMSFASCNKEALFVEDITEVVDDEPNKEDTDPDTSILPCDFTLNDVQPNTTVVINCILDLEGETVNLPANITIEYEGGDIINGTLNFSSNTVISGELLNASLIMGGSSPQLKDTTFNFDPQRWGIVEGKTTSSIALRNRDILENLFIQAKNMGITTFSIDKMDAYFKVDGPLNQGVPQEHAINIPSDFNLEMSSETHLRMQPNGHFRSNLLAIYNEKNITITGGYLHGDREEHDYNSGYVDSDGATGNSHEWVHNMTIKGGQNIVMNNVVFMDAAGDGISISGLYHYYDSRHVKSYNIVIKNCKFLRARRTNVVIVGGEEIVIEDNEIIDGGIDMTNSTGTAPSSNLNIEPVRGKDSSGNLIEYERVSHVYIRNNKQMVTDLAKNPRAGDFMISHGNAPIIVENNEMINSDVSFSTVEGVIIRNNNITQGSIKGGRADNFNRTDVVFNNEIYGNTVVTDDTAMFLAGNGTVARDNYLEGKVGLHMGAGGTSSNGVSNTVFKNNTIKANKAIISMNTQNNVLISDNTMEMLSGSSFAFTLTNTWSDINEEANFVFENNVITGAKPGTQRGAPAGLLGANSIIVRNNQMGEVQINGGSRINVINNDIESSIGSNGVKFTADAPLTSFVDNSITIYPSKTPLQVDCVKVVDNLELTTVTFENQECNEL